MITEELSKKAKTHVCVKCKKRKKLTAFWKCSILKKGIENTCKECRKIQKNKNPNKFWYTRSWTGGRQRSCNDHIRSLELKDIFYKQRKKCYYCGTTLSTKVPANLHIEHKIPVCRGGKSTISNIVICCRDCNFLKFTRTDEEFFEFLKIYAERVIANLSSKDDLKNRSDAESTS